MPVTILNFVGGVAKAAEGPVKRTEGADQKNEMLKLVVAAAEVSAAENPDASKTDVILRHHDAAPEQAIAQEARRGYDILIVGIDPAASPRGGFHDDISKLVSQFEGSITIVEARGVHREDPASQISRILVPVTGNENSRRGAEIAMTLAKSSGAEVSALSVISRDAKNRQSLRDESNAVVDEIKRIAMQLGTTVQTPVRTDTAAEDAILQAVERGGFDLLVTGVSRRPGAALSFGDVAGALLEKSKCSLVFVAPQDRGATRSTTKGSDEPAAR
jgi:nucleotide-binding universal stress UspA family protein